MTNEKQNTNKMKNTIKNLERLALTGLVCMNMAGCAGIQEYSKRSINDCPTRIVNDYSKRQVSENYTFDGYKEYNGSYSDFNSREYDILFFDGVARWQKKTMEDICREADINNNFNITSKECSEYLDGLGITAIYNGEFKFSSKDKMKSFYQRGGK